MDEQLHLGLRGMAHAEAERTRVAAQRIGSWAALKSRRVYQQVSGLALSGMPAPWMVALPGPERDQFVGRALVRVVISAAAPELSAIVHEMAAGLVEEADRLVPFAETVDLLLSATAPAPTLTLRARLAGVREEFQQLAGPTTDVARAAHSALRQSVAGQIGLTTLAYALTTGAGSDPALRLREALKLSTPDAARLAPAMTELAVLLATRLVDTIDLHLDAAQGGA